MKFLIVDANCAAEALVPVPTPDFAPVHRAIDAGTHKIAWGGKTLKAEYSKLGAVWSFVRLLDQAGRAQLFKDAQVDTEEAALRHGKSLRSNDAHVIALAIVSDARVLCSRDKELHADFTDKGIINQPRGRVYQSAKHAHLLKANT